MSNIIVEGMSEDYRVTNKTGIYGLSQGILSPRKKSSESSAELSAIFKQSLSVSKDDASSITLSSSSLQELEKSTSSSSAGVSLELGNATSSLNILSQALDNITTLLEEKKSLEENLPEGLVDANTVAAQERIAEIDAEVSTISSSTTFNDIDLFGGITAGSYSVAAVVAQTGGTTDDDLNSVAGSIAQVEQALSGIDEDVKVQAAARETDSNKVSEDTVSSLVQKIAGEITSPFNSVTAQISIIESASAALSSERVSQLTSN